MPGTRRNKKGTPSKEIADFAQNKIVNKIGQLGEELANYKNEETARVASRKSRVDLRGDSRLRSCPRGDQSRV